MNVYNYRQKYAAVLPKDVKRLKSFVFKDHNQIKIDKDGKPYNIQNKKKVQNKCTFCYKNEEEKLALFLRQDDRTIDLNNPLVTAHRQKKSIPKVFHRIWENKKKEENEISIKRRPMSSNKVIDINNLLINNLNDEIQKFLPVKEVKEQLIFGKTVEYFENKNKKEKENFNKIESMNPQLAHLMEKSIKNIPFIMKSNRPWSGIKRDNFFKNKFLNNNELITNFINKENKINDEYLQEYPKTAININEIFVSHNSRIRKDYSKVVVNNSFYRQNINLNNKHMFNSDIKTKKQKNNLNNLNIVEIKLE